MSISISGVNFRECFFILVYCAFIKKICLSSSPNDCINVNTLFFIIFSLIIVLIIQIIQDLIKTYKDRINYREEARITEDLDEVIDAVNNLSDRRQKLLKSYSFHRHHHKKALFIGYIFKNVIVV